MQVIKINQILISNIIHKDIIYRILKTEEKETNRKSKKSTSKESKDQTNVNLKELMKNSRLKVMNENII